MRHNIISLIAAATAISGLASCEKESFFPFTEGEGQLNCESLNVDYINSGKQVRAGGVSVDDFTVNFIKTDNGSEELVKSYQYGQMPQVVSLPKGTYKAEASFGDNPVAEWESPYYLGNSSFTIQEGKVTDDVEPVKCELSNIRIAINIDDLGEGLLGDDAQVVVKAGQAGSLTYDKTTNNKSGYFRYVEGSRTITATFSGTVDGEFVEAESRTYSNAEAGNFYRINFVVSKPDNKEPGDITLTDGNLHIDATITIVDENHVVDPNEGDENIITDEMERPTEGKPDDPNTPDDPNKGDDPKPTEGPQISNLTGGLILNQCCNITESTPVEFDITSETGLTKFVIDIESEKLSPEELAGFGLSSHLDMINPGEIRTPLESLGLLEEGEDLSGARSKHFSITPFVGLLTALGPGEHKFHIVISDSTGTTNATLWLKYEE